MVGVLWRRVGRSNKEVCVCSGSTKEVLVGRSTKEDRVEVRTRKKKGGGGEYPGTQEARASENQGIRARGGWSTQGKEKRCGGLEYRGREGRVVPSSLLPVFLLWRWQLHQQPGSARGSVLPNQSDGTIRASPRASRDRLQAPPSCPCRPIE